MNRYLLTFVISVGLTLHAAAFLLLHNLEIGSAHSFPTGTTFEHRLVDWEGRQERTALLTEIFDHLTEVEPQLKEELHELHAEYAPTLETAFATNAPSLGGFSFETNSIEISPMEEERLPFLEGSTLLAPISQASTLESPPLIDVPYDDDPYESFGELAGSEHFDVQVEYTPRRFRPGYVFKVTFTPREDVIFKRIRQNHTFLIDRSNSIPRARYALNKEVVSQALDLLQPKDTFNILVFDNRVARLSERPLPWNEENVARARDFLSRHGHGGYFAATELYASLGKIIPDDVSDKEVNTAILLSDGDTYLSRENQRLTIGGWTARNNGKVALYTVASGTGNNLPLMDLLSAFNKGSLIYSQDHSQLCGRLGQIMEKIQHPIGKEMVATAVSVDKQMSVRLQPKEARLPDLYRDRAFVIYGSTNRLSDFVLFLQGKYYDRRFDIKKKVSFVNATLGPPAIEKVWTQLLVQEFYERYFEDGNLGHLEAAKQMLEPLNLHTPLID